MATLSRPLTGFGWDQPADLSNKGCCKAAQPIGRQRIPEDRIAVGAARRRCQASTRRHVEWRVLRAEENRFEITGSGSIDANFPAHGNLQGTKHSLQKETG